MRKSLVMLIVDDLEVNRASMCMMFEKEYEVVTATNGREALEILQLRRIDVVILDVYMPVLDGAGVLAQMKADSALREIPVIVKTAVDENLELAMLEMGADDFIFSPSEPAVIRKRVHNIVQKYMCGQVMRQKKFQEPLYCRRMMDRFVAGSFEELKSDRDRIAVSEQEKVQENEAQGGRSLMSMRVILVDDDELSRQYYTTFLARLGVSCDIAVNSALAVQTLRKAHLNEDRYDVCLVNSCIPNAAKFVREIRDVFPSECMTIACAANEEGILDEEMKSAGVDYIMERPLQQSAMYQLLSNICNKNKEKRESE